MSKSAKKRSSKPVQGKPKSAKVAAQPLRGPDQPKGDSDSKQSRVIALLQSPTGTTIAEMMQATGWQQHSVRGFLAGVVRKRLKLKLESRKVDGNRVYQVAEASTASKANSSKREPS